MKHPASISPADLGVVFQTPLFGELAERDVADLLDGAMVQTYPEDTSLFLAGDHADRFYVVVEGAVRLFALLEDGSETIIEIVGAGTSFAEAAIFASGRFPVNADAMAGARLVRIDAAIFLRKLSENRTLALKMLASMGRWQLRLMGELWQLKAQSPAQRLACYIVNLSPGEAGSATVKLPYPKSLIASRIGIAPESLSRALSRLAELGVESRGDVMLIENIAILRRFCGM